MSVKKQKFHGGAWETQIDVRDFIIKNYRAYDGDADFLKPTAENVKKVGKKVERLLIEERKKGGVLNIDTSIPSSIVAFGPGYLDKEQEKIVGLQTDSPFKRSIKPQGGIRMVEKAAEMYGYQVNPEVKKIFTTYRKTHNEAVFQVYTPLIRKLRKSGLITGLPDAYGRGRIIGDYRRVALYGIDRLVEDKQKFLDQMSPTMNEESIGLREEIADQIMAIKELKTMADSYGYDISSPARNAREAIQWTYFAYLGAIKEQDGAAMSLPRLDAFFDIFLEKDIAEGLLDEEEAQALIDDFVIKLRIVRHLRTEEYNQLFAGDPIWATCPVAGMAEDGRHMVTKTSYRLLHTLKNLGPAPEPNLTVLWSACLPEDFKKFVADLSIQTSSIQYENDDLMRPLFGDDYAIACCVSAMRTGKEMQFFGARCNLAKLLLIAINGGRDEISGELLGPEMEPLRGPYLDYDEVRKRFSFYREWLAECYVNTMNIIHYMHDKYNYEKLQMALHDSEVGRYMAFGLAGLSVVTDSLCAIRYSKVRPKTDERGLVVDYEVKEDFPKYGNDDDRVDEIAVEMVKEFIESLRKFPAYRKACHTLSILTITSNVVYGKHTGSTPDSRKAGEPFAPGANPMHGRDTHGAIASLNSLAKLPYECCLDGISNTFTIVPTALGMDTEKRVTTLVGLLDGYFDRQAQHINVNVLQRETLEKAMKDPEKYPHLTIRVSGYAVNFIKLTPEQQWEVISRTFHGNT
ncbi:formate C-acetyltransferase [candidate division WOR-3 bacterium]|nr:formate C-acetyltransferase [candidate division WOR-3 bacterium]